MNFYFEVKEKNDVNNNVKLKFYYGIVVINSSGTY